MSSKEHCPTTGGLGENGFNPDFDLKQLVLDPGSTMHVWGWLASSFLTLVTATIAGHVITEHLQHYYTPGIQRHKVRVLAYPPAYALLAWLSYLRYNYETVIMFFARLMESFAVYNLYVCLQAYLEPYREQNAGLKVPITTKVLGFYNFKLQSKWGLHFRVIVDILVLQFPVWNILQSLISIIAQIKGVYCDGQFNPKGAYLYLAAINFTSLSIILMALFTYLAVFDEEWKHGNIRAHGMFWCIKGPIMFIFYVGDILLAILTYAGVIHEKEPSRPGGTHWTAAAVKNGYYVLLICAVMASVAVMMGRYFGLDHKEMVMDDDDARLSYGEAFADGYLAFIPNFFRDVFMCGGDTVVLAKKRRDLRKRQRRLSEEERNLLMPDDDMDGPRGMEDIVSLSQPERAHQSKVYEDDGESRARAHMLNALPLEPLAPSAFRQSHDSSDESRNTAALEMETLSSPQQPRPVPQEPLIPAIPVPPPPPMQSRIFTHNDEAMDKAAHPPDHFTPHEPQKSSNPEKHYF
ncbi:hypothetical protein DFQ28_004232 [Apophysomyces sp. BC1034]|nr:hypothetical protein DFQ30_005365 [Apophysomyces sp. BC1015]KAG0178527.1 hypothetical protein DFQ29_003340 [Apophysomyces sp. BC1021]KAG0188859.1 hypothetical protein DFQ28_004232 [Apophysomyces sp. BC1034]